MTEPVDTILLGRNLAEGFIPTWTSRLADPETADDSARKFVETPKVVFSRTLTETKWPNTDLVKGELVEEITRLKQETGQDIIAYGGAQFVSSLIAHNLIDEYHLFVNPVILGTGMPIFQEVKDKQNLALVKSPSFSCGIVVLYYKPY